MGGNSRVRKAGVSKDYIENAKRQEDNNKANGERLNDALTANFSIKPAMNTKMTSRITKATSRE